MHDAVTIPADTTPFDAIRRTREDGSEFWSARELMLQLGYQKWERFESALERAKISAQAQEDWLPGAGKPIQEASGLHFRDSSIETTSGKGRAQLAADVHLSRFACYLVAMNGDPRKPEIAAAQRYFAIRTRQAEKMETAWISQNLPSSPLALRTMAHLLNQLADVQEKITAFREDEKRVIQNIQIMRATHPWDAPAPKQSRPGQTDLVQRIRDQVRPLNIVSVGEIIEALGIKRNRGVEMLVSEVLQTEGFRRAKNYVEGSRTWVYRR